MIRIIIADPDPSARKALKLLLMRKLHTNGITEAGDMEELIRALADAPPDLLLLDWRLYGSPAPETCRLLQRAFPHLQIVLLSVDAGDEDLAKEAGAEFIYKGSPPEDLINILAPIIQRRTQ